MRASPISAVRGSDMLFPNVFGKNLLLLLPVTAGNHQDGVFQMFAIQLTLIFANML